MRLAAVLVLLPFVLGQQYTFNLDCTQYPGPCNNDCYAAFVVGKGQILDYPKDGQNGDRRRAAGCVSPTPCGNGKMATPNADEQSCDEYPYASTSQGGSGAVLRCTDLEENRAEGTALGAFYTSVCGSQPCNFMVTFGNPGGGLTPYCLDGGGVNDGYEYIYQGNGNYELAKKDTNITEDAGWMLHQPDPVHFFPPHLRREFLLANGERTVLPTRDLNASYDDTVFYYERNGTILQTRAVKELFGLEKTFELQDPALRKTAVPFES